MTKPPSINYYPLIFSLSRERYSQSRGAIFACAELDHRVERDKEACRHARLTCWLPGTGENEFVTHGASSACPVGHERPDSGVCNQGLKEMPPAHEESAPSMVRQSGSTRSDPHARRAIWTPTASTWRQMMSSLFDERSVDKMVPSTMSRSCASTKATAPS